MTPTQATAAKAPITASQHVAYESRKRCPPPDIIAIRYSQPDDAAEVTLHGKNLAFVLMMVNELRNEPWFRKRQNKTGV